MIIKHLKKKKRNLVENLSELQEKLSAVNNKLSECQVNNIRLSEHNSQLFERLKGSNLTERLEKDLTRDKEEQAAGTSDNKQKDPTKSAKKSPHKSRVFDRKCKFFENGYCKKNPCNYLHPDEKCKAFSRYGQCADGNNCRLKHPTTICTRYLEGVCNLGDQCC